MRTSKSILAGVAAGALALGVVSVAGASSAVAAGQKSPKAAASTVTAVRSGAVGTLPSARLTIPTAMAAPTTLKVVTAPSSSAKVYLNNTPSAAATTGDDSATLLASDTITVANLADDSMAGVAVDTAGTYTLNLGNGSDTTAVTFTTSGAPTSLTLSPATQTVLVGSTGSLTAALKDASGNATQAAIGDTIAIAASGDDTPSTSSLTAANIFTGSADFTVQTQSSGAQTITATPQGTLPSTGVTAATATVTASGTVSSSAIVNATVASPANALNNPATGNSVTRTTQVPAGSSTIAVRIDDTTANAAGTQIRLGFNLNSSAITAGATINGEAVTSTDDTVFVNVVTGADKSATTSVALGGGAVNTGAVLTMKQYTVTNTLVSGVSLTVSQLSPVVYPANVVAAPAGPLVAALGSSVPLTVAVDDSFGTPQSGWTVQVYRSATLVTSGTTNAQGVASVNVTNAAGAATGTAETYSFTAIPPIGTSVNAASNVTVTYTTSGNVDSLTVTSTAGTSPTSAAPTLTTGASFLVPSSGVLSGAPAPATATFTVATGVDDTTAISANYAKYVPTTSPATAVTVTTVGDVFVTDDTTTATWSNGSRSVTVSSGASVYVYGTKTGVHTVTFTGGGKSVDVKVKIGNTAAMAYNIELSPATQELGKGAFGTAKVKLTDVFGNAVAGSSGVNTVTVSATGEVLLGGYASSQSVTVGATGEGSFTIIAGNTAGKGVLTAVPAASQTAAAWQAGYTKPTGAPSPVVSAVAEATVGESPSDKSIAITGSRATVSGKPGIEVDGVTSGIENGKTVIPYFRFPGQTEYTQGSARPAVTDDAFVWSRKTGKKIYVYVTNDDGAVTSNRIIIAAP